MVHQLFLLLVEVYQLAVINVKYLLGPDCTTGVDIHIKFVRDQPSSNCELSFLVTEDANQMRLRIEYFLIFVAAHHAFRARFIFKYFWVFLDLEGHNFGYFNVSLFLPKEYVHSLCVKRLEPVEEKQLDSGHSLQLDLNYAFRSCETLVVIAIDEEVNERFLLLFCAIQLVLKLDVYHLRKFGFGSFGETMIQVSLFRESLSI